MAESLFAKQSRVSVNDELTDPGRFMRDSRRLGEKFGSLLNSFSPLLMVLFAVLIVVYPGYGDALAVAGVIAWLLIDRAKFEFPFEAPEWETKVIGGKEPRWKAIANGRLSRQKKFGVTSMIMGYEMIRGRMIGLSVDQETRHTMVVGSTGSGKTVLMLAMLYQCLLQPGSSAVFVDGKADIALFWHIFALMKRANRLYDLLVLNFLTSSECLSDEAVHDADMISNKTNPFNMGGADQLKNLVMGLGRSGGGGDNDFWQGRASSMLGALMQFLVYIRDSQGVSLDISYIRESLPLRVMLKNAARKDVPEKNIQPLRQYLKTLPTITDELFKKTEAEIDQEEIYQKADEQHIYNIMMVNETMADLSETMRHIFVTKHSEVNMIDVIMGGRVLLVLLPAISKSVDALAGLGRLLLSGLRPALEVAAGAKLQGSRKLAMDARPSSAKYPVRIFLDEYGMYGIKGFFVLAALVRSYGINLIFGAQVAKMLAVGNDDSEFDKLVGNMNAKIALKNEDPNGTLDLLNKRVGKVTYARQDRVKRGMFSASHDNDEIRVQEMDAISARVLASANPGEGLFIYGGNVLPFQGIYIVPPKVESARLNFFAQMRDPTSDEINQILRKKGLEADGNIESINERYAKKIKQIQLSSINAAMTEVSRIAASRGELLTSMGRMTLALGLLEVWDDRDERAALAEGDDTEQDLPADVGDSPAPIAFGVEDDTILAVAADLGDDDITVDEIMQVAEEGDGQIDVADADLDWSNLAEDFADDYESESVSAGGDAPWRPDDALDDAADSLPDLDAPAAVARQSESADDTDDGDDGIDLYGELGSMYVKQFALANMEAAGDAMKSYAHVSPELAMANVAQLVDNLDQDSAMKLAADAGDLVRAALAFPIPPTPSAPTDAQVRQTVDHVMAGLVGKKF